jgi:hypothetical protein
MSMGHGGIGTDRGKPTYTDKNLFQCQVRIQNFSLGGGGG